MIIVNMILLVIFVVCIVDISGIITSIKKGLAKFLNVKDYINVKLPLIECSLCVSFHALWIYLLITGKFTILYLTIAILFSIFTGPIGDFILNIRDLIIKLIRKIK